LRAEASADASIGQAQVAGHDQLAWVVEMLLVRAPLPVPEFGVPPEDELESNYEGLQWKVIQPGHGDRPTLQDPVTIHWAGRLLDGTVFDSSFARAEPLNSPIPGMLESWRMGLQMMQEGEIRVFVVPSRLAYGKRGHPPLVGPDEPVLFWIQLLKVGL